jgi:type II secretory pathway component GspD/PulD (secretin)
MKTNSFPLALILSFAAFASALPAQEVLSLSSRDKQPDPVPTRAPEPGLKFNFRGAPLETVLNYMSEAAGFIIVLDTPVRGSVDMWSDQPVSRQEAVQLLNIALNKNGYAASVQGRNLIVSSKEDAKKRNIPIHTGNDPEEIPLTAEMVMQIIPLRHIDATQASSDLATLIPGSATLTANKDSNSLIVTDTQINIRHIVEIVAALDTSSDTVSTLRVFRLHNADPVEMAQLLTNLFQSPTQSATGGQGAFGQFRGGFGGFGGFRGFGGGGFGGGGGAAGGGAGGPGGGGVVGGGGGARAANGATSTGRTTPVVAVPDPRTYSVVVTASKDQMPEIAEMVAKLDSSSARKQKVFVYTMENADVKQVEATLKNLFQSSSTRSSSNSTQADPLGSRATTNSQSTSSTNNTLSLGGNSSSSLR